MKISVSLGELSKKLNAISTVVPSKTTMPILATVLLSADDEGIRFSATDLDISVTSVIKGEISEGGRVAAPARKLAEIVKSLSGDIVDLEIDGEKVTIKCGKSKFVVNGRKADDFPKLPIQEGKTEFTIDPAILSRMVHKTIYAVSTDLTRPALCGVLWELDRTGISMVSTDGHRLAKVDVKMELGDIQKMDVIVPPKALATVRSYSEGEEGIKVSVGENSISFEMKESSIYSRLLEGPFPNYQKVIPTNNNKELVIKKEGLADATKRVAILSDALTHQVVFSIGKDKVTLHVNTQEIGEAREELDANFKSDPMDIGYNAGYIMEILRTIEADEISLMLDRPDNAGMLKPIEQGADMEQLCIIMPLRIN